MNRSPATATGAGLQPARTADDLAPIGGAEITVLDGRLKLGRSLTRLDTQEITQLAIGDLTVCLFASDLLVRVRRLLKTTEGRENVGYRS